MPVPDYQSLMLPVLRALKDGDCVDTKALNERVSELLQLSPADLSETLSSGQNTLKNRVAWAKTYLKSAGLLSSPQRGHSVIT